MIKKYEKAHDIVFWTRLLTYIQYAKSKATLTTAEEQLEMAESMVKSELEKFMPKEDTHDPEQ